MTPFGLQTLKNLLIQHEEYRQFPYVDTTGNLTIGIGRNLKDRGISMNEALYMLNDDVVYFSNKLKELLPFWNSLNEMRQIVLIDMCFNLGVQGLLGFRQMLEALGDKDYDNAALQMLESKWSMQVGSRAANLAKIMREG